MSLALGPDFVQADAAQGQGAHVDMGAALGKNANAQAGGHHQAQGVIAGHLHAQARLQALVGGRAGDEMVERTVGMHADQIMLEDLFQAQSVLAGQRMGLGHDHGQPVPAIGRRLILLP